MPTRLVALDDGPDIPLDRDLIVVGRHPQCDARLDSLRVSRRHCCMTPDRGEVIVRDLGSTNGIRINGQRVEFGRLRPGDEFSIAHIRYRLDNGQGHDATLADNPGKPEEVDEPDSDRPVEASAGVPTPGAIADMAGPAGQAIAINPFARIRPGDNPLAAAVREMLPSGVGDRCLIQVFVQRQNDAAAAAENLEACRPDSTP